MIAEITPRVRAVLVDLDQRHVTVRVFHEGATSEEFIEDMSVAKTEIIADFPSEGPDAITLEMLLVRSEEPVKIPALGQPVFARKGTYFQY